MYVNGTGASMTLPNGNSPFQTNMASAEIRVASSNEIWTKKPNFTKRKMNRENFLCFMFQICGIRLYFCHTGLAKVQDEFPSNLETTIKIQL